MTGDLLDLLHITTWADDLAGFLRHGPAYWRDKRNSEQDEKEDQDERRKNPDRRDRQSQ